jgi:hypothetical protein
LGAILELMGAIDFPHANGRRKFQYLLKLFKYHTVPLGLGGMSWSKTPTTCVRSLTGALWHTSIGLREGWQPQLRRPAGRAMAGGVCEIGRRVWHIYPAIAMYGY